MSMGQRSERLRDELEAAALLADGMTIAIGEPAPMAMVRHIIRRGLRDLTVIASGLHLDMLIAAGCVKKAISYYAGGGFGVPVAPAFRARLNAAKWRCGNARKAYSPAVSRPGKGLPFLPWRGGVGTSLPEVDPNMKIVPRYAARPCWPCRRSSPMSRCCMPPRPMSTATCNTAVDQAGWICSSRAPLTA